MAHLLDHVLPVLDKAVLLIPEERGATEQGEFLVGDLTAIPFEPDQVKDPRDIVRYGRAVRDYVRLAVTRFDAAHMQRAAARGPRTSGFETMMLAVEEAIHHRGQLFVYLRLMGVKPPYLYDYS